MRNVGIRLGAATVVASAVLLSGCLDAPEIEDRWTRLDITGANLIQGQAVAPGSAIPVAVNARVTWRSIITGFVVAELRVSTIPNSQVNVAPDLKEREGMALSIDAILANSVTLGRSTRAVTGWDHLQQSFDFNFTGVVPGAATDSTGAPLGLYLLCYLGEGEEIERQGQPDSLIVTPFPSAQYEILPVGMELTVAPPAP